MKKINLLSGVILLLFFYSLLDADVMKSYYDSARKKMVETIKEEARETSGYLGKETLDERVTDAMGRVLRHEFVPVLSRTAAYANRPLPIGYGQTISQPYIVAIMTDLLNLKPSDRVLEIGTGSGYQAAILAEIAKEVYTIEVIEELGKEAKERLKRLRYKNIKSTIADGYYGWQEYAPFDAIIVTAAAGHLPPPLLKQLKPGGRMVIPVGSFFFVQQLILITKDEEGLMTAHQIMPVAFVPLTGKH